MVVRAETMVSDPTDHCHTPDEISAFNSVDRYPGCGHKDQGPLMYVVVTAAAPKEGDLPTRSLALISQYCGCVEPQSVELGMAFLLTRLF
jgi:hypothetical protein